MAGEELGPAERLGAWPPFDKLPEGELRRLARSIEVRAVRRGKALTYQGDRPLCCWLLLSGSVRGVMYRSDETTVELGVWHPGEWLALPELLLDAPCLCDLLAEEGVTLAVLGRAALEQLLSISGMARHFLRDLARRTYALHSRMELVTPLDRLVRLLLERAAAGGSRSVSATQEELAEAIGASRETVNRHLGRLEAQGLLGVGRGAVEILDPDALRRLAE
jgi:CRP-like cAMP-binding protein